MSPEDYGRHLAQQRGPATEEQIERAARILATTPDRDSP